MRLFLMRHGAAESFAPSDAQRGLTHLGRSVVVSKAYCLPGIDCLFVSPLLRALQTADILISEGVSVVRRQLEDRVLPEGDPYQVINEVLDVALDTQMIVAHNPLLSKLIHVLVGDSAAAVMLDAGQIAYLEADVFQPQCAQLRWVK